MNITDVIDLIFVWSAKYIGTHSNSSDVHFHNTIPAYKMIKWPRQLLKPSLKSLTKIGASVLKQTCKITQNVHIPSFCAVESSP